MLIEIGKDHSISMDDILAVHPYKYNTPAYRSMRKAKREGKVLDCTHHKTTILSIIEMRGGKIYLSSYPSSYFLQNCFDFYKKDPIS